MKINKNRVADELVAVDKIGTSMNLVNICTQKRKHFDLTRGFIMLQKLLGRKYEESLGTTRIIN